MSRNEWLKALYNETRNNATFAYHWAMVTWNFVHGDATYHKADTIQYASPEFQKAYSARIKTCKANNAAKARNNIMRSMGLTMVRGATSGRIYWE